jgi:DNA-binding transcriptional MerR regulator
MLRANAMTIGQLSRRTGVPIKVLREYERLGFLYTLKDVMNRRSR